MRKFAVASLLTLWLLLAGMSNTLAQESPAGFAALTLSAEAEKAEVLLGEPLNLKVRLTNYAKSEVATFTALDPGCGAIQVYISRNGSEFKRYLGPGWGTSEATNAAPQIAPGDSVYRDITLLFNNVVDGRDDLFDGPLPLDEVGTYQIRVVLFDITTRRKISAPVIDVQVGFPTGLAEQAIWQAVHDDPDLAYFMQTGDGRRASGVVDKAKQLTRLYPDDIQAKHLALALGRYYLKHDKAEIATGYLKEAAASDQASSLRALALLELARSYTIQGRVDEALKISDAASNEYTEPSVRQQFVLLGSKLRQVQALAPSEKSPTPR